MYEMKTRVTYSQVNSDLRTDMAAIAHYFRIVPFFIQSLWARVWMR